MRLFVAIDINSVEVINQFEMIQTLIKEYNVRATYPARDQFHITLKFLGEVNEARISDIINLLNMIKLNSFRIRLNGVDGFPSLKNPRVIIVKVCESTELYKLQSLIEESLYKCGFKRETRPFKPHITLARIKAPWSWRRELIERLAQISLDSELVVDKFKLKQSILTNEGPIYKDIAIFKLR